MFAESEWMLIDIGYEDTVTEIVDMIRQMDFSLAHCKYLIATHADVDHIQGLKKAKEMLPSAETIGHPETKRLLLEGDRVMTYAEISAQRISIDLPTIKLDQTIDEGDVLNVGSSKVEVWHTPGHTHGQLSFRLGDLLFSGDNIYRDGCVGNIDAHQGRTSPRSSNRSSGFAKATPNGSSPATAPCSARTTRSSMPPSSGSRAISTWPTSGRSRLIGPCSTSGMPNSPVATCR